MMDADIMPDLFPVDRGRLPVDAPFGRVKDLVTERLGGGNAELFQVLGQEGIV